MGRSTGWEEGEAECVRGWRLNERRMDWARPPCCTVMGAEWSNEWNSGARRGELIPSARWIEFHVLSDVRLRDEGVCEQLDDGWS